MNLAVAAPCESSSGSESLSGGPPCTACNACTVAAAPSPLPAPCKSPEYRGRLLRGAWTAASSADPAAWLGEAATAGQPLLLLPMLLVAPAPAGRGSLASASGWRGGLGCGEWYGPRSARCVLRRSPGAGSTSDTERWRDTGTAGTAPLSPWPAPTAEPDAVLPLLPLRAAGAPEAAALPDADPLALPPAAAVTRAGGGDAAADERVMLMPVGGPPVTDEASD